MKQGLKGFFLWILNNSLLFTTTHIFDDFFRNPTVGAFFRFLFAGCLWLFTGSLIIVAVVDATKGHVKKRVTEKELLSYSFIDNSILLSTETVQKNGFHEIWRQESKEHSVQILCFNNETGEFQAFDRFHWMDEPLFTQYFSSYVRDKEGSIIKEPWLEPEGTCWKKDLWTPIKLHFTAEWLKEHIG